MKKLKLNTDELRDKLSKEQMKKISANYGECSGCTQTTPYGYCGLVNGECRWIPEIG